MIAWVNVSDCFWYHPGYPGLKGSKTVVVGLYLYFKTKESVWVWQTLYWRQSSFVVAQGSAHALVNSGNDQRNTTEQLLTYRFRVLMAWWWMIDWVRFRKRSWRRLSTKYIILNLQNGWGSDMRDRTRNVLSNGREKEMGGRVSTMAGRGRWYSSIAQHSCTIT